MAQSGANSPAAPTPLISASGASPVPEKAIPPIAEKILPVAQLDDVLPQADYVVVAAPETQETAQLMSAARVAKMKRGARLINVGRGSLLDEAALLRALESGALAGAAVDVTATEPLPSESPLWKRPIS